MNALILSAKFGLGHHMAAEAIEEQLQMLCPDIKVTHLDLISYFYPHISKCLFKIFHIWVEHCFRIYNWVYKLSGKMRVDIKPSGISIYKKLKLLLKDYNPDVIVCTLPLCAKSIASYIEKTGCQIPLVTCITDISIHPEWITPQTRLYLAPTREIKQYLIKEGISSKDILVTGIPIRKQFMEMQTLKEKEAKNIKNVLILGGGWGIMPELSKTLKLLHRIPGISVTVIAGKNVKLYENWKGKYKNVKVLGYTDSICSYMKEADLVISKAGGCTLFEAIECVVPLLVIHPFLEQEVNNARYAEKAGIAKVVWKKSKDFIPILQRTLLNDKELFRLKKNVQYMKETMKDVEFKDAMEIIRERAGV